MNSLCADVGYRSINKKGEQLCGDHVEIVHQQNGDLIMVLADGLGSGVKACILSTLTSNIISTMMANNMSIEECVNTIAATLPVCEVRGIAYSTFTIIKITNNKQAEIIQFDNPHVVMLRDGKNYEYSKNSMVIDGKNVVKSKVILKENDVFIAMSDGAIYAGVGMELNYGWQRINIISYIEKYYENELTAKTISSIILDKCEALYGGNAGDDTTIATIKIRERNQINLIIGPPANPDDCQKMMTLFFSKGGKHIVCGGTTSSIAAEYLGEDVIPVLEYIDEEVPPIARVKGIDLVTEGIITINKVLAYAQDFLDENNFYSDWAVKEDGASQIARLLFEEATDINFYVGKAVNPAHQNPNLPINFSIKMRLVDELSECLKKMGKGIKVSYF
ncbi:MAG: SpoIIE family protein phosphatase [Clostridiales bacterium]|nr:SpoIIE family protein phosphatase [Clostridiales bacterium]